MSVRYLAGSYGNFSGNPRAIGRISGSAPGTLPRRIEEGASGLVPHQVWCSPGSSPRGDNDPARASVYPLPPPPSFRFRWERVYTGSLANPQNVVLVRGWRKLCV